MFHQQNAEAEDTTTEDEMNDESKDKETWTEDLSRILSGICANCSKAVCISTMVRRMDVTQHLLDALPISRQVDVAQFDTRSTGSYHTRDVSTDTLSSF